MTTRTVRTVVVTNDPCLPQASVQRIRTIGIQLVTLVNVCQDDAAAAAAAVEAAEDSLAKTLQAQEDSLARMIVLRDLLTACGSHVCTGDKAFSKEEVAAVLSLKLNEHHVLLQLENEQQQQLVTAQQQHRQMVERLAKWKRQQDELVARVDAFRESQQARRTSAEQTARSEALSRVLDLTASLEKQFATTLVTKQASAEGAQDQFAAKQAAAEFDRLFGESVAR